MVRSFSFVSPGEFGLCTMVGIMGYRTTILITDLTIFSSRTMGWYHFAHSGEQLFTVDGRPCTRGNSGLRMIPVTVFSEELPIHQLLVFPHENHHFNTQMRENGSFEGIGYYCLF